MPNKSRQPSRGFGLIEVLITAVIGIIVMLGLVQFINSNNRANRNTQQLAGISEVVNLVNMVLTNSASCKASLGAVIGSAPLDPVILNKPLTLSAAKLDGTPGPKYIAETDYIPSSQIKILQLRVTQVTPILPVGSYTLKLSLEVEKTVGSDVAMGSSKISRDFMIEASNDPTTGNFSQCGTIERNLNCVSGFYKVVNGAAFIANDDNATQGLLEGGPYGYSTAADFAKVFSVIYYKSASANDLGIAGSFTMADPNLKQFWGLKCNPGWTSTSCSFFSEGNAQNHAPLPFDSDTFRANNSCLTDDEEHNFGGTISASCCRIGP